MTTANCTGNEELDFRLIFGEDGQQQSLGPADLEPDDNTSFYILNVGQQSVVNNQSMGQSRNGSMQPHSHSHSQVISSSPHQRLQSHKVFDPNYEVQDNVNKNKSSPAGGGGGPPKAFECPSIQITSISPSCQQEMDANEDNLRGNDGDYHHGDRPLSRDHLYLPLDHSYRDSTLSPSPCSSLSSRSWFSDASSCESFSHVYDDVDSELNEAAARFTLGSPRTSPGCSPHPGVLEEGLWVGHQHHHPAFHHSHSLSPRVSPCHSPRTSVTDENWLSPRPPSRPSSRPTSPCGKRRHSSADICYPMGSVSPHHSPIPTPEPSPRGSVTEDTWIGSPSMGMFQCCPSEADIPSKTRKTSQDRTCSMGGKGDLGLDDSGNGSPLMDSPSEDTLHSLKKDGPGEQFLSVPSHFTWNKPKPGHTPIFRTSSLPPLDWPLPHLFGQYELKVEVHPKAHHRAHYETEGSRGAIKAASGGHPVVKLMGYNEKPVNLQMFIGTADDRYLRPHAFYQVHRITGKTVATASQEIIISSTKVLEIPLLPENNMSASSPPYLSCSIDCAGILKLRNSDIELRKGETDIGRKNTRVRVVFRVHIPQPNGKVLSLQAASIPVECSQRSAQELPQVEKASLTGCLVSGGEEMVITGSNFFPESKVIFLEKGPDGRPQWEVEAKIIREKSQGSSVVVEVPPYHSKTVTSAVQVQFYVCNGKRKRSQSQRFTYLSVLVKQEHNREEMEGPPAVPPMPGMSMPLAHAASLVHSTHTQLPSPEQGHPPDGLLSSSPRGLAAGPGSSLHTLQPACPLMGSPSFQHLPHLQGRGLHTPADCHMTFHPGPAPPNRPSYQHHPMQQSHTHPGHLNNLHPNLPYNGQPSLSMNMNTGAPQSYERMPYHQQQQSDPGASHPHPMGLGMVYHSSPSTSSQQASSPHSPISTAPHSQPMTHSSHSAPHLLSMGYHCPPNPSQVPSPTRPNHPMGQPSPTLTNHPIQPSPQLQRAMGGYHPTSQRSASCPTTSSAPPAHMVPSPHSGPSSPQLHSLPYQSPTSPTGSPLCPPAHSPQASSPVMSSLSPGSCSGNSVQQHPLAPQQNPFPMEGESVNIKQEPEEREPTFRTIGLQDITLDDVNEIIGRDMSQSPGGGAQS
ncbi:nuclear factor of activated T-cells, cytoplasmic 3-like isoform X1 [Oncorhynchus keta]|uniref:nuclear factor of activated T-cells, cytoplasmic 3-like isoform X1 n=1 Tax=Oncorhynchus keta TaxID=8018 RepID=UPI00227B5A48|nr:nuclear factor of activated T-cells, cytoplasmic 3-like isoform X1 [Oncorhynchus keta]